MGNSLHNKIYLGRRVAARRVQLVMALGLLASSAVFWLTRH